VNLEYLAQTVWTDKDQARNDRLSRHAGRHRQPHHDGQRPGVLGWGVGGIEAEAAMLGQPHLDADPRGRRLQADRQAAEGATATDLVLTVTQMLRKQGVVEQVRRVLRRRASTTCRSADRATIANMAPNTAPPAASSRSTTRRCATCKTAATRTHRNLVEAYAKAQACGAKPTSRRTGLHLDLRLDLGDRRARLAGPKRPQDRVPLTEAAKAARQGEGSQLQGRKATAARRGANYDLKLPRRRRDRGDHLLHQHLEPLRADRRRPVARKAVRSA
jgi:aconitate hydratase